MKRPTLLGNLSVALLISLIALGTLFVLQPVFFNQTVLKITLSLITLCYLAYLFYTSQARPGKVTLALLAVLSITSLPIVIHSISILLTLLISTVWLSRCLLFYQSITASLVDLALCLLGLAAAIGAFLLSTSIAAGVWCFLLIQALFIFIPQRQKTDQLSARDTTIKPFNKAYQSAESAIRHLANKS